MEPEWNPDDFLSPVYRNKFNGLAAATAHAKYSAALAAFLPYPNVIADVDSKPAKIARLRRGANARR
jgi:hypothetical protein